MTILNDDAKITYTFTGNGNITEVANWLSGLVPPGTIATGNEVIIDPSTECVQNVPVTYQPGAKLTIKPGKKYVVAANLTLLKSP